MKTEQIKLSQVKVNGENPRSITNDKFAKLVNSILVFPKMLSIRPVVVDNKMVALGGNMRLQSLKAIAKMTHEDICNRLNSCSYQCKDTNLKAIHNHYSKLNKHPNVVLTNAKILI